ncbi:MAG: LCP family protein, partial [Geodermatophilaceae bacterium]
QSATVPSQEPGNPFGNKERVNVLLLGGDGLPTREGVRTDTVIVASTDTESGATTLLSLPRNLENLPFPEGPLRDAYPDGFEGSSESAGLLNAVYDNLPIEHPGILGPTDNLGADALKLGVGEALGLTIDYYLLINLDGFRTLVDILGGIRVNVNEWIPIGGDDSAGIRPDDYLTPGPSQLLQGSDAVWYARGRYGLSDYSRMARQRCAMDAIIGSADPFTLLSRYQDIAETAPDLVLTDIPRSVLPAFVDLGVLVKDAEVRSLVFDNTVIIPAYPDYDLIRDFVATALADPVANGEPAPPTTPEPSPTTTTEPVDPEAEPPAVTPEAEDVASLCAYDRVAAQEALDQGEPPTRRR